MELHELSYEELEQVAGGKVIWVKTPNGTIPIHLFKAPAPVPSAVEMQTS